MSIQSIVQQFSSRDLTKGPLVAFERNLTAFMVAPEVPVSTPLMAEEQRVFLAAFQFGETIIPVGKAISDLCRTEGIRKLFNPLEYVGSTLLSPLSTPPKSGEKASLGFEIKKPDFSDPASTDDTRVVVIRTGDLARRCDAIRTEIVGPLLGIRGQMQTLNGAMPELLSALEYITPTKAPTPFRGRPTQALKDIKDYSKPVPSVEAGVAESTGKELRHELAMTMKEYLKRRQTVYGQPPYFSALAKAEVDFLGALWNIVKAFDASPGWPTESMTQPTIRETTSLVRLLSGFRLASPLLESARSLAGAICAEWQYRLVCRALEREERKNAVVSQPAASVSWSAVASLPVATVAKVSEGEPAAAASLPIRTESYQKKAHAEPIPARAEQPVDADWRVLKRAKMVPDVAAPCVSEEMPREVVVERLILGLKEDSRFAERQKLESCLPLVVSRERYVLLETSFLRLLAADSGNEDGIPPLMRAAAGRFNDSHESFRQYSESLEDVVRVHEAKELSPALLGDDSESFKGPITFDPRLPEISSARNPESFASIAALETHKAKLRDEAPLQKLERVGLDPYITGLLLTRLVQWIKTPWSPGQSLRTEEELIRAAAAQHVCSLRSGGAEVDAAHCVDEKQLAQIKKRIAQELKETFQEFKHVFVLGGKAGAWVNTGALNEASPQVRAVGKYLNWSGIIINRVPRTSHKPVRR